MYNSRRDVFDGLVSGRLRKVVELMLKLEGEKLKAESIRSAVKEIRVLHKRTCSYRTRIK